MNTAEYLVKRLNELGINDFFGLPGDYNFNIINAINNNQYTKWIGCASELNAGYAADGYARTKGYGAVVTTYGVGELSAINAVAGSFAENVPVVCIVGIPATPDIENKTLMHHNLQDVNYRAYYDAYKSVTAEAVYLSRDNAKIEIDRVLKILAKEKKPVYIAIPKDIAVMEISDRSFTYEDASDKEILKIVSEKIAKKISESKRPVILGDVLIKRFNAQLEYKEFVEKSGIPVTNFIMGIDLIDMDYEKYIGGYFASYKNQIANKYIKDTDCLIAVGTMYTDLNSFGFNIPFKINNHIAVYGNYTYIEGKKYENVKMSDVLASVTELINTKEQKPDKPNIGYKHRIPDDTPLTSEYIYSRIQEFMKENDIVISETGLVPHGIAQMKIPNNINMEFQLLWGSIGWATPAALGACLAKPQSRVVLITGEGAHQISAMEIGNMLRLGVKPIIIVINNNGYTTERYLSENSNDNFNEITKINYAKFARIFEGDVWATKIETEEDFDKALKVTQIMNKMCYLEVCTDSMDTPAITKDITKDLKEKITTKPVTTTFKQSKKKKKNTTDEIISTSSGFSPEYETTVHKSFVLKDKE